MGGRADESDIALPLISEPVWEGGGCARRGRGLKTDTLGSHINKREKWQNLGIKVNIYLK